MQSGPPAPPFRPPKRTQPSNNKEKDINLSGSPHPNHPNMSQTRSSANESMGFKGQLGSVSRARLHCVVSEEDKIPYIGRKGIPTQNVLAICDFDMLFTYFVAGWPGSVHDNRILKDAMEDPKKYFPHPPEGKYYVVDVGYPNMKGFLAPFKGERYHVPDFRRSTQPPNGFYEVFNYSHSSLRNVIERTFGVWKKRWRILSIMPSFPLETQKKLVAATMAMHNYIRRHALEDLEFDKCDADPYYIPEVEGDVDIGGNPVTTLEEHDGSMDDFSMESIRYNIATSLMSR
uniref:DDE Tnp4 domain-containing protein n=1 Tax=Chenopodium quinoa TaxID=63459 RepID=A0A803LJ23_CHEQI